MTGYAFQFTEQTLDELQAKIKRKKAQNPKIGYIIQVSVDLVPDGVGYETRNLQVSILATMNVDDMNKPSESKPGPESVSEE